MYDFLLSEAWWMKTIITALIAAGATIISAIIAYRSKIQKVLEKILEKEDNLSTEHKRLEQKHGDLSSEHKSLSSEHKEIRDIANQIFAFQREQVAVRQEAARHMPHEMELNKLVYSVFEHNKNLIDSNIDLQNELSQIQFRNHELQEELKQKERMLRNMEQELQSLRPKQERERDDDFCL